MIGAIHLYAPAPHLMPPALPAQRHQLDAAAVDDAQHGQRHQAGGAEGGGGHGAERYAGRREGEE